VKDEEYTDSDCVSVNDAVLEKECIFEGRINIRSKTGQLRGWMKKDLFLPNRINVYDKHGNIRGYWVRDTLDPDAWFFNKGR